MAAVTLNEISQQNNTNLGEQKKQTGFLKELVNQYRKGMLDAVEKEREKANKEKKSKDKKNPFGPRWKQFTDNMRDLNKGFTSFKLPSFLKKVIFGAVVLSAVKLLYQNWETISETWKNMKPGLIKLKDNVIALKNRFGELGISLGDVAKTILLTYTAVKVWQMGSMLLRNAGLLITGIKLISSTLLSATALMMPGIGGGTRRGGAVNKNAGIFAKLKNGARLM